MADLLTTTTLGDYLFLWGLGIVLLVIVARFALVRFDAPIAVFVVLVANALADVTTNYFEPGPFTPGSVRFVVLVLVVTLLASRAPRHGATRLVWIFAAYTWALLWFSSDVGYSATVWGKVCMPMFFLSIGYGLLAGQRSERWVVRGVLAAVAIIVLQIVLAQVFRLGESVYIADSFYLGGGVIQITYTLVLFIAVLPFLMPRVPRGQRAVALALALLAIVLILLFVRRGSYAGLGAAIIVYALASPRRGRFVVGAAVVGGLLLIASPLYSDLLMDRVEGRGIEERGIEEEGRYRETLLVVRDLERASPLRVLFGTELFNSPAYFKQQMYGRQLHVDYNILLHGAGVLGLLLYLSIFAVIMFSSYRLARGRPQARAYAALVYALCAMDAVMALSGTLGSSGYRSLLFLFLGLLLRQVRTEARTPRAYASGQRVRQHSAAPASAPALVS